MKLEKGGIPLDEFKKIEVVIDGQVLTGGQNKDDNKIYLGVRQICEVVGLSIGQMKSERNRVQNDPLLRNGTRKSYIQTNGGKQMMVLIEVDYLPVWLCNINKKHLNSTQYEKLISLINYCFSADYNTLKYPTKMYQVESELRDDIYNLGCFNNYKIKGKELSYPFGRVDLLAEDDDKNTLIIELKKNKNYNDVIEQCKRYEEGFKRELNKDVKIVICTLDDDSEFLRYANLHGYEVYKYERKLELHKVV